MRFDVKILLITSLLFLIPNRDVLVVLVVEMVLVYSCPSTLWNEWIITHQLAASANLLASAGRAWVAPPIVDTQE